MTKDIIFIISTDILLKTSYWFLINSIELRYFYKNFDRANARIFKCKQIFLDWNPTQSHFGRCAFSRGIGYILRYFGPVRPEDPSYPRKFENTLLSFLIFGGVYLIMSLTASILREQVWPYGNFKVIFEISPTITLQAFFLLFQGLKRPRFRRIPCLADGS